MIAYEDDHRVYSGVMERVIRDSRPHLEVKAVPMCELGAAIERIDPHVVLCERQNPAQPGGTGAWIKLSYEPDEPSEVCLDGQRWELDNPGIEQLLTIVDKVEDLMRNGRVLQGC
ncbi:MAG TPA: hypothetical protein VK869_00120 [Rubrobacteraceae bacterium]|nr:hypothetical protein [Rubrobacteraceae bacterium]